jgi:hypothetical protein
MGLSIEVDGWSVGTEALVVALDRGMGLAVELGGEVV